MTPQQAYDELIQTVKEIAVLGSVSSVLGWDERTQLPNKGADSRAAQMALLAKTIHAQFTAPRVGELLGASEELELASGHESDQAVNIRELRRSYDRATKLPSALVEELSRTEVLAQHAWADARKKSDFKSFAPWLSKTLDLVKKKADCLGYTDTRYDALLD
jgi:carboxypeptidase Taq